MKLNVIQPWTKNKVDQYVIEDSDLGALSNEVASIVCPGCGQEFSRNWVKNNSTVHLGADDKDIFAWHFTHICGAELIIFND